LILVDTSVWVDRLAGRTTSQVLTFDMLARGRETIATGDLIVTELLQGARSERHADALLADLRLFACISIVGERVAIEAARN
jgi:hypothetical protein